jgi:hypothetical protein
MLPTSTMLLLQRTVYSTVLLAVSRRLVPIHHRADVCADATAVLETLKSGRVKTLLSKSEISKGRVKTMLHALTMGAVLRVSQPVTLLAPSTSTRAPAIPPQIVRGTRTPGARSAKLQRAHVLRCQTVIVLREAGAPSEECAPFLLKVIPAQDTAVLTAPSPRMPFFLRARKLKTLLRV